MTNATPPRGSVTRSQARRAATITLVILAPVLAVGIAWWATRPGAADTDATADAAGHDHSTMGAASGTSEDSTLPVSMTADQARRIGVTFAPVTRSPITQDVRASGQVVVDETRLHIVTPKVDGFVERLHVNQTGQPVRVGDPLLDLYSPMVVSAQEELLLARRLATDTASEDGLVAAARRRLAWWDIPEQEIARLERTGEVARTVTLRSPASGIVLEKSVTAGQRIMAGEALYRIADLSRVWIEGEVYEQDLRSLSTGQQAVATFDAFPGERFTGRVEFIYPTLSAETRSSRVRVAFANPGARLKPGLFATLQLTGASRGDVLTVPRSALLSTGTRTLVFVRLADGRLESRAVQVGAMSNERAEIISGLAEGDTVVASATFLVDAESNLRTALGGMTREP